MADSAFAVGEHTFSLMLASVGEKYPSAVVPTAPGKATVNSVSTAVYIIL
jgi:hypothetical protein